MLDAEVGGHRGRQLPEGWDTPIPDSVWPDALLAAVRKDASALGSARVVETIRQWRAMAHQDDDLVAQKAARRRLDELARALVAPPIDEIPTTAFEAGFKPGIEDTGPIPSLDGLDTDSAVSTLDGPTVYAGKNEAPWPAADGSRITRPRPVLRAEQSTPRPRKRRKKSLGSASPEALVERPTRANEKLHLATRVARGESETKFNHTIDSPSIVDAHPLLGQSMAPNLDHFSDDSENPTIARPIPLESAPKPAPPPPPAPSGVHDEDENAEESAPRLPPTHGVVKRSKISTPVNEPPKPRASMIKVKALYGAIIALCRELVPLTTERRSRRFWTHWRDVSQNRGVRREAVEALLERAEDARTIAAELIAEVQSVDLDSVHALLDKIDAGDESPATERPSPSVAERDRGPLVGASVSVEGVEK